MGLINGQYSIMKQCLLVILLFVLGIACKSDKTENDKKEIPDISHLKVGAQIGGIITPDKIQLSFKKTGTGNEVIIVPNGAYLADLLKPLEANFIIIYYDMRNRGRSQTINNANLLEGGILNDVKDLEAVRQHFKLERINLLGHSYLGLMAVLYAKEYPQRVDRIIQIGTFPPFANKDYSKDFYQDSLNNIIPRRIATLETQKVDFTPQEFCERWWRDMRLMHLGNTILATQLPTRVCNYRNEQPEYQWKYFQEYVQPSIEKLTLSEADIKNIQIPVLTIHGTKDRITPMGGAKDWKRLLTNGKLLEIEGAGHFPFLEEPQKVFNAITEFIGG